MGSCGGVDNKVEDVVDPRNLMPTDLNRLKHPESYRLATTREASSIPKAGTDRVWEYPSDRQLFNAFNRKEKDVAVDEIAYVTSVHNRTNEMTWQKILTWEKMHLKRCSSPKLIRFAGRSDSPSLKSYFVRFSHLGAPFDRHDWYIDRCGQQVKYIIDYYDDQKASDDLQMHIDARPAMNSFRNFWDRLRFPVYNFFENTAQQDSSEA